MHRSLAIVALFLSWGLTGCEWDPGTGPVDVKWDRKTCERCRMVLSDRKHSAEVRVKPTDGKSKVLFFDDIGCAVIWLEDKPFREDASTEIWVTDWRNGEWIDARAATYLPGQVTPMEYGLGAQPEPAQGGLDYAQAKAHIFDVERRFNVHGAHLEQTAAEREETGAPREEKGPKSGQE
ncbi:MAG: hypothetical protein U9Q81_00825 [Pseudomonadota bacterium]|nr:hypothetical protein [Pseudomonadota bacterium]